MQDQRSESILSAVRWAAADAGYADFMAPEDHLNIRRMGRLVLLVGLALFVTLALPGTADATSLYETKKLLASDAEELDFFGTSVSIDGDTLIVGAQGGGVTGAAYVFQRDEGGAGNWGEVRKLTAPAAPTPSPGPSSGRRS